MPGPVFGPTAGPAPWPGPVQAPGPPPVTGPVPGPHLAAGATPSGSAGQDDDPAALDRLSRLLYDRLRGQLTADLLVDRERAHLLTDLT